MGLRLRAALLVLVAFATPGSVLATIVSPNLAALEAEYGASPAAAAWIVTAFLITAAVSGLTAGPLIDRLGARGAVAVVGSVVVAGSVLAALSPGVEGAIAGRALQGLSGAAIPIALTVARHVLAGRSQARALGLLSTWGGVGGGLGLVLGGPIVHAWGPRAVFWVPAIAVAVVLAACPVIPPVGRRAGARVDWPGILLLGLAVVAALAALGGGTMPPALIAGLAVLAVALAGLWWRHERRTRAPAIDPDTVRGPGMPMLLTANVLAGAALLARLATLPGYLQTPVPLGGLGLDATVSGLLMVPTSVGVLLGGWIAGRIAHRVRAQHVLAGGLALIGVGMGLFVVAHDDALPIAIASGINGLGVGSVIAASTPIVLAGTALARTAPSIAVVAIARALGQACGPQLAVGLLSAHDSPYPLGLAPAAHVTIAAVSGGLLAVAAVAALLSRGLRRRGALPTAGPEASVTSVD